MDILEVTPPENNGYQRLWVPHRMAYIGGEKKPVDNSEAACPFCDPRIGGPSVGANETTIPSVEERAARLETTGAIGLLVVARGQYCFVILNLFPYNSGHILVVPYRHISWYTDLTDDETKEFSQMTKDAIGALTTAYHPQGFNIGMNQGEVGGAGIAAHLHQHVVPRWTGDSNFLPIIAHTKAMPEILSDTRDKLSLAWPGSGAILPGPIEAVGEGQI